MLVEFQKYSTNAVSLEGVMPSKFCSGNICCDNHRRQKEAENGVPQCKEFVIIGECGGVLKCVVLTLDIG